MPGKVSLYEGGWFRTGDLGNFDSDGWLYLIGRSKEVINRGGELVSPFEIDSAASAMPGVQHCLSFAVPHEELGEAIGLAIVAQETIEPDEIKKFLSSSLSAVKIPEMIIFMPSIPKGPTGKPKRIELSKILGVKLSAATPKSGRYMTAQGGEGKDWVLTPLATDDNDEEVGVDSLGFAKKFQSEDDVQLFNVQQALYGCCAIKLMWQHWLPPDLYDAVPQPDILRVFLETIIHCRTLLVMIFPLLGYFDGAAVLSGEHPMRRAPVVAAVYVGMSWPYFYALPMMHWAEGYATFHCWPMIIWLLCLVALVAYQSVGVPPWFQVVLPFALAPFFRNTVDSLHGALGLEESPPGGGLNDPTFLVLEHSFWWSVGAKLYFAGCYFFAFHYMAPRSKMIAQATRSWWGWRVLALFGFAVLTAVWQHVTKPYDPMVKHEELSDWPQFLGMFYPFQVATDWLAMALLVVGVGKGAYILRLLGESILGTMVAHMYFALPFGLILTVAYNTGGPVAVLLAFFLLPMAWTLTLGAGFQYCCLKAVSGATFCWNYISQKAPNEH